MGEVEPHVRHELRVLRVHTLDKTNVRARAVVRSEHAGGIFARHRVDGVFFESGGEKAAMKVEYG